MFYKNLFMSLCQFWFAFFNGFSGQKYYTEAGIQLFNVMFTSIPILLLGAYDMDVSYAVRYTVFVVIRCFVLLTNLSLYRLLLSTQRYTWSVCETSISPRGDFGFGFSRALSKPSSVPLCR